MTEALHGCSPSLSGGIQDICPEDFRLGYNCLFIGHEAVGADVDSLTQSLEMSHWKTDASKTKKGSNGPERGTRQNLHHEKHDPDR